MEDSMDLALLIVRIAIGLTIFVHGYSKFARGGKLAGTAGWFDSIGMRPGKMHAFIAASGEVGVGLFLAAGFLTSFAALGMVGLMVVAAWVAHRGNGFLITKEGWEYTFVLAVIAVGIAMLGPGDWSADDALDINHDLDGWTGLIISAVGGVSAATLLLSIFYHPPQVETPTETPEEETPTAETPGEQTPTETPEQDTPTETPASTSPAS